MKPVGRREVEVAGERTAAGRDVDDEVAELNFAQLEAVQVHIRVELYADAGRC